jgi:hypothetical protein
MGTRARPAQLRPPAGVQQFLAARARKAARDLAGAGPRPRYRWPADRAAIITATVAAAGTRPRGSKQACE